MERKAKTGDDPDELHTISQLVSRLAKYCLKGKCHNPQEEDLERLKLKALAVLREYQGFQSSKSNDVKRLELLSATLQLHQAGRSEEADRLLELSDKLSEVCGDDHSANGAPPRRDDIDELPFQTHEPFLHLLLSLQGIRKLAGENDRSASARSNGAGSGVDPFSHQLRSMHDEVGSRERRKSDLPVHDSSGSSWPNTQGSVSPGLDHMLSAMRSIPCWDAGTLGSGRPAVPSRAALGAAGASLLYHMEALPDESRTAWQFSGHDRETSHGENDMNNSHSVNGALGSSAQTGLNGNIKAESDEEEWPLSASWGHHMPHKSQDTVHVVNEGILAYELLLALQGVVPAILRLESGHFRTESLSQASLSNLLKASIQSGVLRAHLDVHLSRVALQATSGPTPDPCLQAFAAAAIEVLREQSVALQSVAESVRLRRKADLQHSIRKVTPGSLRHHLACVGVTAATDDDLTILEVTVHTRALQAQLRVLATVCGLDGLGPDSSGAALLDHLHAHLEGADAAAAPLLRRLLLASYRPYAEQLEDWLFRPATCLPPGSAFCGQLPAHLACLLPSAASTQAMPCSVPAFLQRWEGQVVLAGLHLRVLHCMPAPLDRLAMGLADIAAAERVSTAEEKPATPLTGAETFSRGMTAEEHIVAMPLTFHSTQLNKIEAAQDAAIMDREEFISSRLAEAAATAVTKRNKSSWSAQAAAAVGSSPEGIRSGKLAAHEPAFLGTMRVLTAAGPSSRPQLFTMPPGSPTSTSSTVSHSTSCPDSGSDCSSEASSAESSPRELTYSLNARMGALPHLGAPEPSALKMASTNGVSMGGPGPRLPNPWMVGRPNGGLSHGHADVSAPACDTDWDSDEDEETVPLEAAVEACIVRRVLSQYACTGSACLRCLEVLGLGDVLAALERYAFMGAGDWAAALVQLLAAASISVEAPWPHDLRRMLDDAVHASTAVDDPYSATLSLRPGTLRSALVTQHRPSALLSLQLCMDVRWPLSIVIDQSAMAQYNEVFGFLLELRMMSFQLQQLWLESVHRHGVNDNAWAFAATVQRVKELRSFRTAATQVLDAVQGYISAQLHSTSLAALMQEIRGSKDLVEARAAVFGYLARALRACLLGADMQRSAALLSPVLQAISDCLAAMLPALRSADCNLVEAVMSDRLWQRMHAPMCAFDAHMRTLVAQSKLSADQEVLECVLAHLVMNDHWLK